MTHTHVLGFPRIGARRELKFAVEAFWRGEAGAGHVEAVGRTLRERNWRLQEAAGLSCVAVGDFSFYDTMLDHSVLLGAIPERFGFDPQALSLARYFELARGNRAQPAMEMTKWFDTNYHYLVPEVGPETPFESRGGHLCEEVREALALGLAAKPVLIGPLTYLRLAKTTIPGFDPLTLLPRLVGAYTRILRELRALGIERVQLDEPALCTDLQPEWLDAYDYAYGALADAGVGILLATYFGATADYAERLARLPLAGIHIDAGRAPETLQLWRRLLPRDWLLSVGVVDGRNVWRNDLRATLARLRPLYEALGERLWIAPSCSLLHVPVTLEDENGIDAEVKGWLAFATEKLEELGTLARGLDQGDAAIVEALEASDAAMHARRTSKRAVNAMVRREAARMAGAPVDRHSPFEHRAEKQRAVLGLPLLPTTTIGSFPQTPEIRRARAGYRKRELKALDYLQRIRAEIETAVRRQEALGLDVIVHGEAERNDMVEFFAEHLWGYAITANGWVQSYGSRCVKPPIVYGDVFRPEPITVDTIAYARSLTDKPVKGMLTGPVTMLQWSFVRDDEPRSAVAMQIALAVRDEVADLEKSGVRVVQIDEPALREGLPLKRGDWWHYLEWAVRAFKLCASAAADETQIHTHMCYAEFGDILPAIAAMDADVITIETSRSNMALLEAFRDFSYPNDIGPGIYDIHSPRVPTLPDMLRLIERAAAVIPVNRLWINPDCGLKTRSWDETEAALRNMVEAARLARVRFADAASGPDEKKPATAGS